jgi:hypothetical protein
MAQVHAVVIRSPRSSLLDVKLTDFGSAHKWKSVGEVCVAEYWMYCIKCIDKYL